MAERLSVEEGIALLSGKGEDHQMVELFNAYCLEAEALKRKIDRSKFRQETRQFRLNDLKKRLIPQIQAKIYAQL